MSVYWFSLPTLEGGALGLRAASGTVAALLCAASKHLFDCVRRHRGSRQRTR